MMVLSDAAKRLDFKRILFFTLNTYRVEASPRVVAFDLITSRVLDAILDKLFLDLLGDFPLELVSLDPRLCLFDIFSFLPVQAPQLLENLIHLFHLFRLYFVLLFGFRSYLL